MIYGIGIDIIEIARIKKAIERNGKKFIERVFTSKEINYCENTKNKYQCFAGRFSAKEAVIKALKLSDEGVKWRDIEILNNLQGIPEVNLHRKLKAISRKEKIKGVISISHSIDYAVASVVLEGNK